VFTISGAHAVLPVAEYTFNVSRAILGGPLSDVLPGPFFLSNSELLTLAY
jgi:hypothetical protein